MGEINTAFVKLIATVWHRFTPSNEEASTLADMLIPMDLAGEEVSENFEFDDVDCYIGQDGSNTNTQFMGELYEVSMHKGLQPCSTISTLTPNFGDTLFYYTFGE